MKLGRAIRNCLLVLLLAAACGAGYIAWQGYSLYAEALEEKALEQRVAEQRAQPGYTEWEDLPETYIQAVIAVEDHRFYEHRGIDLLAMGRALWNDLRTWSFAEGGSTITQQLAKNQYFTQEQTVERKIAEVFMALTMEQHFSKRTILELYVNSIYFGDGYEGIGSASWGYFGKAPSALDADECTLLAGIPNAPSVYALSQNPGLARERQQEVLRKLVSYDYLGQDAAQHILGNLRALAA
mgnify:CR=1 FL=1